MVTYGFEVNVAKGLTDISGVLVGHASDWEALTGCTVILTEAGAVGGVWVGGSATGTEELAALEPGHVAGRVHAVVLSGGSAFGLEAASGVRRYLERQGIGFETSAARVPIVPCAILYDLGLGRPASVPRARWARQRRAPRAAVRSRRAPWEREPGPRSASCSACSRP